MRLSRLARRLWMQSPTMNSRPSGSGPQSSDCAREKRPLPARWGQQLSMIPLDFDVMTSGTERRSYRHLVPVADVIPTVKGRDVRPNRDKDDVCPTRAHVNASQDIVPFGRERLGQFQKNASRWVGVHEITTCNTINPPHGSR